jgi:hypothetical protein
MAAKIKINNFFSSEHVYEVKLIPCKLPIVLHTFCMAHSVQTINSRWPPNTQNNLVKNALNTFEEEKQCF